MISRISDATLSPFILRSNIFRIHLCLVCHGCTYMQLWVWSRAGYIEVDLQISRFHFVSAPAPEIDKVYMGASVIKRKMDGHKFYIEKQAKDWRWLNLKTWKATFSMHGERSSEFSFDFFQKDILASSLTPLFLPKRLRGYEDKNLKRTRLNKLYKLNRQLIRSVKFEFIL